MPSRLEITEGMERTRASWRVVGKEMRRFDVEEIQTRGFQRKRVEKYKNRMRGEGMRDSWQKDCRQTNADSWEEKGKAK